MDDDLRSRYRRDFTSEPIKNRAPAHHTPRAPKPTHLHMPIPRPQTQPPTKLEPTPVVPAPVTRPQVPIAQKPEPEIRTTQPDKGYPKAKRQVRKKRGGLLKKLFILIIIAGLAGGGYYGWLKYQTVKTQPVFNKQVAASANFPVFYPTKLPSGYRLATESINYKDNVLAFYVTYDGGKKLAFTEQKKPENFNFDSFHANQIDNAQPLATPVGKGVIGKYNGSLVASVPTSITWIIMAAPSGINTTDLTSIAQSLTAAQ